MSWEGGSFQGAKGGAGLPFAGIPEELRGWAQQLLDKEPEHPDPEIDFGYVVPEEDRRPFSLRRFFGRYVGGIALAILLVAIDVATEQIGPFLLGVGIDSGVREGDGGVVLGVAIAFGVAVVGNIAFRAARIAFVGRLGQRMLYALRVRIFSHLQRQSLDFYTDEKAGRILTRMTSDVEALQALFGEGLINLAVQLGVLVFITGMLFAMNATLAVILLGAVLPFMIVLTLWFRNRSDRAFLAVRDRIADVLADLSESLAGIRVVAMHNRQRHNEVRHRNLAGDHMAANLDGIRAAAWYGPGMEAVGILGQALLLAIGARMIASGSLQVGELAAFLLYLQRLFGPIQQIVQLYTTYQQGRAAVVKIRELLATEPTVPESPVARDLPPVAGEVTLDRVTFGYTPGEPALKDVSIRVEPGETFALVGPTGAGKSTIAKLVSRFYDPDHGTVEVDGHDLRHVTLRSLRRQVATIPQEPFLFASSIRDNIAFARPGADDEEIWEACRAVGIEDVVAAMPQGLDTLVHERGVSLSSGERQLIALARAFIAQPRVLVLDEATSNLDLGTEAKIEDALDTLLSGRTAILIAHRLSTAMRADRIAVVEHGRIVELGAHEELLEIGGRYAQMFRTWVEHGGGVRERSVGAGNPGTG